MEQEKKLPHVGEKKENIDNQEKKAQEKKKKSKVLSKEKQGINLTQEYFGIKTSVTQNNAEIENLKLEIINLKLQAAATEVQSFANVPEKLDAYNKEMRNKITELNALKLQQKKEIEDLKEELKRMQKKDEDLVDKLQVEKVVSTTKDIAVKEKPENEGNEETIIVNGKEFISDYYGHQSTLTYSNKPLTHAEKVKQRGFLEIKSIPISANRKEIDEEEQRLIDLAIQESLKTPDGPK